MGFDALRERFVRLRNDDITPEEADRAIQRLGAQAARLYCYYAKADTVGFDLELCQPQLKFGDEQGNELLWQLTWQMITGVLSRRYPGHLPRAFGDGDVQPARAQQDADADVQIFTTSFPPGRWRQRCEDHAAACDLLARLAGEVDGKHQKQTTHTTSVKRAAKEAVREILAQPKRDALVRAWQEYGTYRAAAKALKDQGYTTSKSSVERAVRAARMDGEDLRPATPRSAVPRDQVSHARDTSN